MNGLPKYVVSSTLASPRWTNSTVLQGDVVDEVAKLKQELDGEIVVYASVQLVHTLMEHDLVDELRLMVFPVVLGAGERLFGETSDSKPLLRLLHARTVGRGRASVRTSSPRRHDPVGVRHDRKKGSPSRWRFRPPPPLTFRPPALRPSAYSPWRRLRPTRAPCSVHAGT